MTERRAYEKLAYTDKQWVTPEMEAVVRRARMTVKDMARHWTLWGRQDPLWAVLTTPGMENNRWDVETFLATGRREIDQTVAYAQSRGWFPGNARALDFGCGVGRLTQALAHYFPAVDGVDISSTMIEKARQINQQGDRCRFHLNQKDDLSLFSDMQYDWVHSAITLQHIDPIFSRRYLAELMRILAPGGLLVFQLPSARTWGQTESGAKPIPTSSDGPDLRKRLSGLYYDLLEAWQNLRVKCHYRYRAFIGRPLIHMYGLPREEVVGILERAGGQVLEVREDRMAGDEWISLQYFATRKRIESSEAVK